jgi:hypothetical protein
MTKSKAKRGVQSKVESRAKSIPTPKIKLLKHKDKSPAASCTANRVLLRRSLVCFYSF